MSVSVRGPLSFSAAALACVALLSVPACSSDDGGGSGGAGTSTTTSSTGTGAGGDPTPEESCTHPGDEGNDKGVGEYCTPAGKECSGFAEAPLCLATVGQDQWFCTRIGCSETTDCGEGAGCLVTGDGSACVPCRCDDTGIGCAGSAGGAGGAGGSASTGGAGGK